MMAPSAMSVILLACSGVDIPNPMAQGMFVALLTEPTISSMPELKCVLVPVTPREDTTYTNPSAFPAIVAMRSEDVGAIMETSFTPCFVQ